MDLDDPILAGRVPEPDRRVRLLLDSGRIEECEALFDDTIASAPNLIDGEWNRSIVLVHRAVLAWRLNRIPLALELAADGWAELDIEQPQGAAAAHTISMLGYLLEGHSTPALELLSRAVRIARSAEDDLTLTHCLVRKGTALTHRALSLEQHQTRRWLTDALDLFDEAIELSSSGALYRRAMSGSARALVGLGELDSARERAADALRLSRESTDMFCASIANWVFAEIHGREGRLEDARTMASRALESAEQINDTLLITQFSTDLGTICEKLGDPIGEATALRRALVASRRTVAILREGMGQALEQRRLALQAQRLANAAEAAAVRDPLTGLTNRLGLERYGPGLLEQTASKGRVSWLLVLDVDWFKGVNDTAGHASGDVTLQEVAQLLKQECRAGDVICRWAGDEFVVLLIDSSEEFNEAGPIVAERIRNAVDAHNWGEVLGQTGKKRPTVSIGAAAGPAKLEELFAAADTALYRAKQAGRNRVEVDSSGRRQPQHSG